MITLKPHSYSNRDDTAYCALARYFSDGQNREIHSVSALRKIPMHGGGSDLAAGLNHVMRGPRGSEYFHHKYMILKGPRSSRTRHVIWLRAHDTRTTSANATKPSPFPPLISQATYVPVLQRLHRN
ncbi:hypothetical protein EYF80_001608 [Liparis tanakae]|uniref:Uncharacterized protein n=1 Tax=Liparis tanakae TaxID=230148 RepID=A0A4Z2JDH4_9TELE|nr:hypothetical protein EYF80_001608 [Liparis tanakae]